MSDSRKNRSGFWICGIFLLLIGLSTLEAGADVVHLKNGRTMEGVVLEDSPEQVLLKVPFGEIGLPRESVQRVERGQSTLEQYLDRSLELDRRQATAREWLELALWADSQGLGHSAREATLVAARLDPGLPGLIPPMTEMGYQYEVNLAVWVPHEEIMRRRGYVLNDGRWLSPSQVVEKERAQGLAVALELERQRQERVARAMEMMVLAQVARAEETRRLREEATAVNYGLPLWGGYPVIVPPIQHPYPPHFPEHHRYGTGYRTGHSGVQPRHPSRSASISRPPGGHRQSTRPAASHRGGFQPPPDQR